MRGTGKRTVILITEDGPRSPDSQLYLYLGRKDRSPAASRSPSRTASCCCSSAGGSVPAIVDWEAEGLLDELPDERAREARRELLDELHADGMPVEELARAVREQRLALLPVERLLGSEECYSQRDIAERSGRDLEDLQATRRALGL